MIISKYKFLIAMGRDKFEACKGILLDDDYQAELFRSAQVMDTENDVLCMGLLDKFVSAGIFTRVELDAILEAAVTE